MKRPRVKAPTRTRQGPPERWRPYFDKSGVEFSYSALSRKVGLDNAAHIRRVLTGQVKSPTEETIETLAHALGMPRSRFLALVQERESPEPFRQVVPTAADALDERERQAVLAVIEALLRAKGIGRSAGVDEGEAPPAGRAGAAARDVAERRSGPVGDAAE